MKHIFIVLSISYGAFACQKLTVQSSFKISKRHEQEAIEQAQKALKAYKGIGPNEAVYGDFLCHAVRKRYQRMEAWLIARIKNEVSTKRQSVSIFRRGFLTAASVENIPFLQRIIEESQKTFSAVTFAKIKSQALRVGVSNAKFEVMNLLFENSAASEFESGESALSVAMKIDNAQVVKFLLDEKKLPFNVVGPGNFACLLTWVLTLRHGLKYAKMLLDRGADPNGAINPPHKLKAKCRPLMYAATTNRREAVSLLLTYGADPDIVDGTGATALHQAARHGNVEIVTALAHGVPFLNEKEITEALAASRSEVWNGTYLHRLPQELRVKVLGLSKIYANSNIKDASGRTALDIARLQAEHTQGNNEIRYRKIIEVLA